MDDCALLHIADMPDADVVEVATDDSMVPDTRLRSTSPQPAAAAATCRR